MRTRMLPYITPIISGAVVLFGLVLISIFPLPSYWLDVSSIRVFDAKQGEPIIMAAARTINADFSGKWTVTIRRVEPTGLVHYCTSTGASNYAVNAALPDPLTLKWWTYPNCHPLPVGKFTTETCWKIDAPWFFPDKNVCVNSNIFEVNP